MSTPCDLTITVATPAESGEIWTVQRAAYVDEAQTYGDPFIVPLTETREQVERAITSDGTVLKAVRGGRLVGSVRGQVSDRTGMVNRLCVAPDQRRHGIARALVVELERRLLAEHPEVTALTLFTGHGSDANLRLYRELGYSETHRERFVEHVVMVHLRKAVPGRAERADAALDR